MSREHGARRGVAAWLCVIAIVLLPVPASPSGGAPTIALVDLAVRASEGLVAESAWLGPAVTELLQAKMQLFGGARVLERLRVRALLREAKVDAGAAADETAALAAFIPAEVLIAGSVSIDRRDARRVRVQVRAFEVETSRVVSEATFSGTGDLAGLLKIAEDLARALAGGLKLAYTPQQLAYAEPVRINTLRLCLEGEGHLTAGKYREAIASLQSALDGNEGRYYAAAHRLQGEAYQALARASAGEQERAVREEYLKKFKEDALLASGALFDLGLAYQTNGIWKEASETFGDYIKAVGTTGETVRWRVDLGSNDSPWRERYFILEGDDRLHLFVGSRWIVLNPASGEVVGNRSLTELLGLAPDAEIHYEFLLAGVEKGVLYFVWAANNTSGKAKEYVNDCGAAAIGPDLSLRWRKLVSRGAIPKLVWFRKGLLHLYADTQTFDADGRLGSGTTGYKLFTLGEDGELRSGFALPLKEGDHYHIWGPDLRGLDTLESTLALKDGLYDLATGKLVREWEKVRATSKRGETSTLPMIGYPTGFPGVTWESISAGVRILHEGKEVLVLPGSSGPAEVPPEPGGGYLLFEGPQGYLLVNPENWAVATLYGDLQREERPLVLAQGDRHLLFGVSTHPTDKENDQRYGLPSDHAATVLNLVAAPEGRLLAKYLVDEMLSSRWRALLIGGDPCIISAGKMTCLSLAPRGGIAVIPAAEAHLRLAESFLALKDLDAARRSLASFEAALPSDPRAYLVKMRLASLEGKAKDAAAAALGALASGIVAQEDTGPCLDAIRRVRPEGSRRGHHPGAGAARSGLHGRSGSDRGHPAGAS